MASSGKKIKTKGERRGKIAYSSGLELARVLKEKGLTVFSPKARFLIRTAKITGTEHLSFVNDAIEECLISDTLEAIRKESDIITKERLISAIMSGKYKISKEESEDEKDVSEE